MLYRSFRPYRSPYNAPLLLKPGLSNFQYGRVCPAATLLADTLVSGSRRKISKNGILNPYCIRSEIFFLNDNRCCRPRSPNQTCASITDLKRTSFPEKTGIRKRVNSAVKPCRMLFGLCGQHITEKFRLFKLTWSVARVQRVFLLACYAQLYLYRYHQEYVG